MNGELQVTRTQAPTKTGIWIIVMFIVLCVAMVGGFHYQQYILDPSKACGVIIGAVRAAGDTEFKLTGGCLPILQEYMGMQHEALRWQGAALLTAVIMLGCAALGLIFKGRIGQSMIETEAAPQQEGER